MSTESSNKPHLTHWGKYGAVYKRASLLLGLMFVGAAAKAYAGGASRGTKKTGTLDLESTDRENRAYWETEDGPAYPKGDEDPNDWHW